jgi:hypothetical protein
MLCLIKLIFGIVLDLFRSRAAREAEILVLRQQIIVLRRDRVGVSKYLWRTCHIRPEAVMRAGTPDAPIEP